MEEGLRKDIWLGVASLAGSYLACRYVQKNYPNQSTADADDGPYSAAESAAAGAATAAEAPTASSTAAATMREVRVHILYGTTTGTARGFAQSLQQYLLRSTSILQNSAEAVRFVFDLCDLAEYDEDALEAEDVAVFLLSTWEGGKCPEPCAVFMDWLQDYAYDFRVSKAYLSKIRYAVFGLGGELYGTNYCKAVRALSLLLTLLAACNCND